MQEKKSYFCQNVHLILCILMELFLFSYTLYETSPHKKVHLETDENTEHRQSSFHDRAPHCCSQSSLQDQIESGSVRILHLQEHQTYYWNKDKSKNMSNVTANHVSIIIPTKFPHHLWTRYFHCFKLSFTWREKKKKKKTNESIQHWHQLEIMFLQLTCGRMSSCSRLTYCSLLATSPVFHPIMSSW